MRLKFNFCKIKIALSITLLGCFINGFAQTTDEFIGNGNTSGVTVSTSDDVSGDGAVNTLNGLSDPIDEATIVRLFQQTRLAYDYDDVQNFSANSVEEYINQQIAMPLDGLVIEYEQLLSFAASIGVPIDLQRDDYLAYAFYNKVLTDKDQLRLKAGFALSQILVTSFDTNVTDNSSDLLVDYFDILYNNAFGNFRDILEQVTYHLAMGRYLSYVDNKKADPERGTFPDENFAREIMQLFTIGLVELNNDGSHKLDENGNSIPTYDNNDIVEMAKVFTGLENGGNHKMIMVEEDHDTSEKIMIDGSILPANRESGNEDINDVLDILFNHPNTGPFISTRLIQQLVKSNPSEGYVNRVASAFNNSKGIRGDMEAVFKAILLDPEARDCTSIENTSSGKLLQPIERYMFVLKAMNITSPSGRFYLRDFRTWDDAQRVMGSQSVFNFFSPFFSESEIVEPRGLVSPEFQIFNSVSSIQYFNTMESMIKDDQPFNNRTRPFTERTAFDDNDDDKPFLDVSFEENLYTTEGAEAVIDHYNLLLCRGQLPEEIQEIILNTITEYEEEINGYDSRDAVTDIALFIATSPVFGVLN